ncbi:MAG: purine-nucleoside phosphorylase [Chitinophagaceae bacterium]|nr:purine-nucleoside phosphorylase [Chitinophagaceae bacterium]
MNLTYDTVKESAYYLQQSGFGVPTVGIVLGTGLGNMVEKISNPVSVPYSSIPYFPESTVEFHKGSLIFGQVGDTNVVIMQGRFHYYEGFTMQQITFPIRVMKELGIKYLFLSNAAGGMNPAFRKGDLVIVEDHINLLPDNPLRGLSDPLFGQRFVDMSQPYDAELMNMLDTATSNEHTPLQRGTYISVMGPNLETKAEYRWLRSTGADMVGMSTVPEVIVANQVGIKCVAVSVITDECDPENLQPINISEIIEIAGKSDKILSQLFEDVIKQLSKN